MIEEKVTADLVSRESSNEGCKRSSAIISRYFTTRRHKHSAKILRSQFIITERTFFENCLKYFRRHCAFDLNLWSQSKASILKNSRNVVYSVFGPIPQATAQIFRRWSEHLFD